MRRRDVMAVLAYVSLVGVLSFWDQEPGDGVWGLVVFGAATLMVGAFIASWWALGLAVVAPALTLLRHHATGCLGSDGCEDVLAVFFIVPVAALLLIGLLAGKLARRVARRRSG